MPTKPCPKPIKDQQHSLCYVKVFTYSQNEVWRQPRRNLKIWNLSHFCYISRHLKGQELRSDLDLSQSLHSRGLISAPQTGSTTQSPAEDKTLREPVGQTSEPLPYQGLQPWGPDGRASTIPRVAFCFRKRTSGRSEGWWSPCRNSSWEGWEGRLMGILGPEYWALSLPLSSYIISDKLPWLKLRGNVWIIAI